MRRTAFVIVYAAAWEAFTLLLFALREPVRHHLGHFYAGMLDALPALTRYVLLPLVGLEPLGGAQVALAVAFWAMLFGLPLAMAVSRVWLKQSTTIFSDLAVAHLAVFAMIASAATAAAVLPLLAL